jgi:putative hydrolase of HD superfamily
MSLERLIEFAQIIGILKETKRFGWISQASIVNPESVADHSFRCAVLAMCLGAFENADTDKLVKMLLLHDIHEAVTGDYDSSAKKEKGLRKVQMQQRTAIRDILSLLVPDLKAEYLSIWEEFEDKKTPEAILANDIDKIEMIFQALKYEKDGQDPDKLDPFWTSAENQIRTPSVRRLFTLLKDRRTLDRQAV